MPEVKTTEKQPMSDVEKKFARAFPKAKMVKIRLPRHLGGDKKSLFVGVNGHSFQIPTGKDYEVPYPIYDRLKMMEVQMDVVEDIRDGIRDNSTSEGT